jgi:hypothetical protein
MHDETLLSFEEMQERGHKVEPHITVTANDGWVFTGTHADVSHKLRGHEQQLAQEEVRVRALAQEESNRVIVKALRLTRHAMEAILHVDEAFEGRSHVRRMEAIDKSIKAQKAAALP